MTQQHHSYITITTVYYILRLMYEYFTLPAFADLCTGLKRGKAKKGKIDLIGAEEGEDPFADMSSVGESYIFLSTATSRSPLTFTCRLFTESTFTIKATIKVCLLQ